MKPGKTYLVRVKIKRGSPSGISNIALFAGDEYARYSLTLDVGFTGRLKITPANIPLSYNSPATFNLLVVDDKDKPIPLGAALEIKIQAVDAELNAQRAEPKEIAKDAITLAMPARARSSPQFRVTSKAWSGGNVHVLASLNNPDDGSVLAQDNFYLQVQPAMWLPILLAMGGSLLYWLYSFLRSPKGGSAWWGAAASVVAGLIAYLFAGFDLLGLKLDPNVLKTYALLGFLFSYVGIEVLLGRRFSSQANTTQAGVKK